MFHDRQDLIGQICSRICHDVISPLGAISNGLELLSMSGTAFGPELELIDQSAESAKARIKFFRVAFGRAPGGEAMSGSDLGAIAEGYFAQGRVRIDWLQTGDVPRRDARLVFLCIACLESALAYGGVITVDRDATGWTLSGAGDKLRMQMDLWDRLTGTPGEFATEPGDVHFVMLRLLSEYRTPPLDIEATETSVRIRL